MTNNYNVAAVALLNELTYCKLQAVHEEATGMKAPTPHDIVLSVNGVEAKLDSNAELLTELRELVTRHLRLSEDERRLHQLKEFRHELDKVADEIHSSNTHEYEIKAVPVHMELRGKRISPTVCASVYLHLHQMVEDEINEYETFVERTKDLP